MNNLEVGVQVLKPIATRYIVDAVVIHLRMMEPASNVPNSKVKRKRYRL
jgi:hypothetical protein